MQKENNHLTASGKCEKFSTGPKEFKPGPTFERHVKTPENAVKISTPNAVVINVPKTKINMYKTKNALALSDVLC